MLPAGTVSFPYFFPAGALHPSRVYGLKYEEAVMGSLSNYPPGVTDNDIPGNVRPSAARTKQSARPASFYDSKGHLYVDCSECERGGNGMDADKCSSGWKIRTQRRGGCYAGTIVSGAHEKISKPQGTER